MAQAGEQRGATPRRVFLAGFGAGAALVGLAWLTAAHWERLFPAPHASVQVVSTFARADARTEPVTGAPPLPTPAPSGEATEAEAETPPVGAKYGSELPVYEKLVAQPLSREPHQIIGAWDEDAEARAPGQRRAFVLAVSPGQSDASLESLARDVRGLNLDALLLDVRIYDDAGAAIAPRIADSGQTARQHLVAEIQRNPAAGVDVIRVRGRAVEP